MVDFYPCHASRSKDGCVYNKPRKNYNSTNLHINHRKKLAPYPREHAAIIMLRRHGHRINHIAELMFRSTSYIHKILTHAKMIGSLPVIDQRKMQNKTRLRESLNRWKSLSIHILQWQGFIEGSEDKPP